MGPLGLVSIRAKWRAMGLGEEALQLLENAWRSDTKDGYTRKAELFNRWCAEQGVNVATAQTKDVVNWLASLTRLKAQSKMTYVNAVTSLRAHSGVQDDPALLKVVRQALRAEGAVPSGPREHASLDRLFVKLLGMEKEPEARRVPARGRALVLLKLVTLARSFDMQWWLSETVRCSEEGLRVTAERTKGRNKPHHYKVPRCKETPELCPVAAFERYWRIYTANGMPENKYVWRAVTSPYKNVTADTISSAVRKVFNEAGYSVDELRPHDLRR